MRERPAKPSLVVVLALLIVVLGFALPTGAQETPSSSVRLLSPYLGVSVEPGDTASFDLELRATSGERVEFEIANVPEDWDAEIRGGGFVVDSVLFDEDLSLDLELKVDVPADASQGDYEITVNAQGAGSSDSIDFKLTVSDVVGGGVSLNAEFPALRGPSDVVFSFTLELQNETTEEVQFGLQAQGPSGWQVDARPAGESRAASVTVDAGGSERLTVEVDPPDSAPAGQYGVVVQAAGAGDTATAELLVEITGNFNMTLTTPDERLNLDVEAGTPSDLPLVIYNDGTAPLVDVSLSATPPSGWSVSFSPESIDRIEPGGSADVTATVNPSTEAITGDYRITLRANVAETNDSIEVRATVETSAIWGLVGVGIILAALVALAVVFRRFGRR